MWTFVMAMLLYPDVQKKAQEEIDRVIGSDRLPEHTDRGSLPYVNAVMREGLRSVAFLLFLPSHGLNSSTQMESCHSSRYGAVKVYFFSI